MKPQSITESVGQTPIPAGALSLPVQFSPPLRFRPSAIRLWVPMTGPGADKIDAYYDNSSLSQQGFTAYLGGPTPDGSYMLFWEIIP